MNVKLCKEMLFTTTSVRSCLGKLLFAPAITPVHSKELLPRADKALLILPRSPSLLVEALCQLRRMLS